MGAATELTVPGVRLGSARSPTVGVGEMSADQDDHQALPVTSGHARLLSGRREVDFHCIS
jgi:hypothetical protein